MVYCLLCYDIYHVSGQWTIHSQNSMELPRLNQYQAEDKVSCSRTLCSASVETGTHDPYIYFIIIFSTVIQPYTKISLITKIHVYLGWLTRNGLNPLFKLYMLKPEPSNFIYRNMYTDLKSEYVQEIPQAHTAYQPMALRGRDTEH